MKFIIFINKKYVKRTQSTLRSLFNKIDYWFSKNKLLHVFKIWIYILSLNHFGKSQYLFYLMIASAIFISQ